MATHSSTLAWRIPWSLAGCCPQGLKDSDMIEHLTVHFFIFHDQIPFFVCLSTTYQNISILCQS